MTKTNEFAVGTKPENYRAPQVLFAPHCLDGMAETPEAYQLEIHKRRNNLQKSRNEFCELGPTVYDSERHQVIMTTIRKKYKYPKN